MSSERLQILGFISTLPQSDQDAVHDIAQKIRDLTQDEWGNLALALVGMEKQEQAGD